MTSENLVEILTLDSSKIILFGGKGGVGKTTVAASSGIFTANQGKKTLVFSIDPAHSLSDCFEQQIGEEITQVNGIDNLFAIEVNPPKHLELLKKRYQSVFSKVWMRLQRGVKLPFDTNIIKNADELTPPGLDEILALSTILDVIKKENFEIILIDTAAGFHTIRLLQLPNLMYEWSKQLLLTMRQGGISVDEFQSLVEDIMYKSKKLNDLFFDKSQTSFVIISISEKMGINVTNEMKKDLDNMGISCNNVVVNFIQKYNASCDFCNSKRNEQLGNIKFLNNSFSENQIFLLPFLDRSIKGKKLLKLIVSNFTKYKTQKLPKLKNDLFLPNKHTPAFTIPDDTNLLLFGGKGGCGKTTCAATVGLNLSKKGKKVLIISTDPQKSLSDTFEQKIGNVITKIDNFDNLHVLEVDSKQVLDEFKIQHKKTILSIISEATYLEEENLEKVLDLTLSGLDEVMALIKLITIIKKHEYDIIILDTAPTGHTLKLLQLPNMMKRCADLLHKMRQKSRYIIRSLIGRGMKDVEDVFLENISMDILKIYKTLHEKTTQFVIVTKIDDLAIAETKRLSNSLKKAKICSNTIICNGLFAQDHQCTFCNNEKAQQLIDLKKLQEHYENPTLITVPLFPFEIIGIDKLCQFEKYLCT